MGEVNLFAEESCTDEEFEKVRNGLEFGSTAKHLKVQNIAIETVFNQLNFDDAMRINEETDRYLSVKRNEVAEVIKKYVVDANSVVINYLPANGISPGK